MSRGKSAASAKKGRVNKKIDDRYNSPIVERLIRAVMLDGKSTIARGIVYKSMEIATEKMPSGLPESITIHLLLCLGWIL